MTKEELHKYIEESKYTKDVFIKRAEEKDKMKKRESIPHLKV